MFDLIYCAGGNQALGRIAASAGFLLGIRSGSTPTPDYPVSFVDIDYRRPNFEKHLAVVSKHRPKYATVPDLSDEGVDWQDVKRALAQYEQLTNYCKVPLIVPNIPGQIAMLPSDVAIGYSIPTSYGGARYPLWELEGRRVHLLGGSPHQQMDIYQSLGLLATVTSADGNMAMKMATQFAKFWQNGAWVAHPQRQTHAPDLYYQCWQWSCVYIRDAWERLTKLPKGEYQREGMSYAQE